MATSTIKAETVAPTITTEANSTISAQTVGRMVVGTASFESVPQGWNTRGTISPVPKRTINIVALDTTLDVLGVFRITTEGKVQIWQSNTAMKVFSGIPFCYDI